MAEDDLVRATLTIAGTPGAAGSWSVATTGGSGLKVWMETYEGYEEVTDGDAYSGAVGDEVELLLEGVSASDSVRDLGITATFTPDNGPPGQGSTDSLKATVFDVQVAIDGPSDGVTGAVIGFNDDDDDADGNSDFTQDPPVLADAEANLVDDDLRQVSLSVLPANLDLGTLTLADAGAGNARLWEYDDGALVEASSWDLTDHPFVADLTSRVLRSAPPPGTSSSPPRWRRATPPSRPPRWPASLAGGSSRWGKAIASRPWTSLGSRTPHR